MISKKKLDKPTTNATKDSTASSSNPSNNYDEVLKIIADYVHNFTITSNEAYHTAMANLADTLGCGILALKFPACTKLLGPIVPSTVVPNGSRVPGTKYILDPISAAFN